MSTKVLLLTPPFTQLNTPYPATMYLKGFLNLHSVESFQQDLGIEVILKLFNKKKLSHLFETVEQSDIEISDNSFRILSLKEEYIACIDTVIRFLQGKNSTLAYSIADGKYLPQASRFDQTSDLEWAFGAIGIQDKAKYFATLFLQDLSDFIRETTDSFFGFNRYAERLGQSATSFDALHEQLNSAPTFTDEILLEIIAKTIANKNPDLVLISVPFPGNLYAGFRICKYIKTHHPKIKLSMGGGFPNTELRSLSDPRVFEYLDFITLDDGERPVLNIIEYLEGKRNIKQLKRTFTLIDSQVTYINGGIEKDFTFAEVGTPDYSDILTDQYLDVLEVTNPMHRMWGDGRWNKLTMAHGCYWKKCSFCDISLDYISRYEPITATIICDRMEEQIEKTGETGFHFVDEAAPPSIMKELAIELLKRKLKVTWWANIRFESSFTHSLCQLLSLSGCVAVSGGLEVASNRLLTLMEKGVSVEQVAKVCNHFTEAGILVHSYLMYGFPTQTAQETIDSLENVRQLFQAGIIQSGFWHQFAMTAHSPVGKNPEKYKVSIIGPEEGSFANNDLYHDDPEGAEHEAFSDGLKKSLFNYMHGIGFEFGLDYWFDFKVPKTKVKANYIETCLETADQENTNIGLKRILFIGTNPEFIEVNNAQTMIRYELKNTTIDFIIPNHNVDFYAELFEKSSLESPASKLEYFLKAYSSINSNQNLQDAKVWNFLLSNGMFVV